MSQMEWPSAPVDLTTAAELFARAGRPVDRTNLGRFVVSRDFPHTLDGRRKMVDARALFEAYANDFTRQSMAGELTGEGGPLTPSPAPDLNGAAGGKSHPAGGPDPARPDPKRELASLKVQSEQLDLAARLGKTVPIEEVNAAQAEAMAKLIAAFAEATNDTADELLQDLHLAANMRPIIRAALKRLVRKGRDAFAARVVELIRATAENTAEARARFDALVALALELSGQADETIEEAAPELAAAE